MAQLLVELTQRLEWCGVPSLSQVRDLAKLRTVGTEARWHNDGPDAQCLELERTRHVALYAGEVTHDMASVLLRHAEHRAKGLVGGKAHHTHDVRTILKALLGHITAAVKDLCIGKHRLVRKGVFHVAHERETLFDQQRIADLNNVHGVSCGEHQVKAILHTWRVKGQLQLHWHENLPSKTSPSHSIIGDPTTGFPSSGISLTGT